MRTFNWMRGVLVVAAGWALWLLLAGPEQLLGWDTGRLGMGLLTASAWGLLYLVSRMPGEALQRSAPPAEWKARIGAGFTAIAIVYFFTKIHVFNDPALPHNNLGANAVGRNLVLLLIAWIILSEILASRWKGAVEEDERDREIAVQAAGWGHGALMFCIIGIAVMLNFTPDRLEWATPLMIGNLLIFALMWGWLCEYVATLFFYWRDRMGGQNEQA